MWDVLPELRTLVLCLYSSCSSCGAGVCLKSRDDVLSLGVEQSLKCAEGLKMMPWLPVMHISAGSVRDAISLPVVARCFAKEAFPCALGAFKHSLVLI